MTFPTLSLTYHLHLQCKVVIKGRIFLQVQTSLFCSGTVLKNLLLTHLVMFIHVRTMFLSLAVFFL